MLPRIALIDPVLTYTAPPAITAGTGLDALTQCLEPFVSHLATPLTDGFCREGMRCAARSLRRAFHVGSDTEARQDMALASLCGGLALSNAKLGAVHGLAAPAAPIGGMFNAPHGAVCARLLPFVMETNVRALEERTPAAPALARYREVAAILTGDAIAGVADGIAWTWPHRLWPNPEPGGLCRGQGYALQQHTGESGYPDRSGTDGPVDPRFVKKALVSLPR